MPLWLPPTIISSVIGTPVALGFNSGSSNQSITTSVDIPGDAVVLVMVFANANGSASSVGGNAASLVARQSGDAGGYVTELWAYRTTGLIASGATIATTNAGNGGGRQALAAAYVTGLFSATADKTAGAFGSPTTTLSASTGVLSQPNEIVIGCFAGSTQTTGAPTVTDSAGFTTLYNKSGATAFGSSADTGLTFSYQLVSGTTSITYSTSNTGGTVSGLYSELVVASFKGF
jgi:hypothetical protein